MASTLVMCATADTITGIAASLAEPDNRSFWSSSEWLAYMGSRAAYNNTVWPDGYQPRSAEVSPRDWLHRAQDVIEKRLAAQNDMPAAGFPAPRDESWTNPEVGAATLLQWLVDDGLVAR